jgi:hypothetical protein
MNLGRPFKAGIRNTHKSRVAANVAIGFSLFLVERQILWL